MKLTIDERTLELSRDHRATGAAVQEGCDHGPTNDRSAPRTSLVDCFRSVRRHLTPGARLIFDVFNPSVRMLAQADGVRRRRDALSFVDPDRGVVHVDVAETDDAAAQVTHGRWYFSTDSEADCA